MSYNLLVTVMGQVVTSKRIWWMVRKFTNEWNRMLKQAEAEERVTYIPIRESIYLVQE